ncbi:uncharacterized protein LOC110860092 [Folsomia candida]|nr:uncharacterized protein LOC110860092 [Folsomia candida]
MLGGLFLIYSEEMRSYTNTLFAFNRRLVARYVVSMTDWRKKGGLFMNVTLPILCTQIVLSAMRYCSSYKLPLYLTHFWGGENGGDTPLWLIALGAVQDVYTSGQLVAGTLFLGWATVAHATSLEFWMEEAHCNNESDMTREDLREHDQSMELYRMAQLLSNLFNHTVGKVAIPMCAFLNFSAAIGLGYLTVRSMNHFFIEEFPSSFFFPFGAVLTLCSAFAQFQIATVLHDMSASFLDSWSNTEDLAERRFLVSCGFIKTTAVGFTSVTRKSLVGYFQTVSNYIIDAVITFP